MRKLSLWIHIINSKPQGSEWVSLWREAAHIFAHQNVRDGKKPMPINTKFSNKRFVFCFCFLVGATKPSAMAHRCGNCLRVKLLGCFHSIFLLFSFSNFPWISLHVFSFCSSTGSTSFVLYDWLKSKSNPFLSPSLPVQCCYSM